MNQRRHGKKMIWIEERTHTRLDAYLGLLRAAGRKSDFGQYTADAINEKIDRDPTPVPIEDAV